MTVATELLALGASDHVRQSILGHEHDSVINRHYTQANLELMKSFLDRIDLGLAIEVDARRGFPVIRGCTLLKELPLRVNLTLDANNQPRCIEIHEPTSGVSHVIMPERAFDSKDRAAVAENLDRMGRRLAAILTGRRYRIEGMVDETVQRVLGVLLAVAFAGALQTTAPVIRDVPSPCGTDKAHRFGQAEPNVSGSRPRLQARDRGGDVAVHPISSGRAAETTAAGP